MKAIRQHAYGGPESLRHEDVPKSSPKAGEVLVQVRAAGVTPTELLWQTSAAPRPLPFIPRHEFSGEIAVLGDGVSSVGVGETLYGMNDWFGAKLAANRSQFYLDIASEPYYGFNPPGATVSEGVLCNWWPQGMMGEIKAH